MQMNTRIDDDLKLGGDAVLRRYGLTPSSAVRALWQYLVTTNSLPEFLLDERPKHSAANDALERAEAGQGLALKLAHEAGMLGKLDALSYDELREVAFEEMLAEREERT